MAILVATNKLLMETLVTAINTIAELTRQLASHKAPTDSGIFFIGREPAFLKVAVV